MHHELLHSAIWQTNNKTPYAEYVTHQSVWMGYSTGALLTSVVMELCCPLRLPSDILATSDTNLRPHVPTCCPDITSLSYTVTSCRWISCADNFCACRKRLNHPDSKKIIFQEGHHSEVPQMYSFCPNDSNDITVNTRTLCRVYQEDLKFQHFRRLE